MSHMCQGQQSEDQLEVLELLPLKELLILEYQQEPTLEQLEALLITLEQTITSSAAVFRPYSKCQGCVDQRLTGPATYELKRALEYPMQQVMVGVANL